jgi:hypothetical protein
LSARTGTLFFSLALAYLIAAYSEFAPIGICTFVLAVMFVRRDKMRVKRLMLMSSILLIALMNPCYLVNLIGFLGYQYNLAANAASLWDNVAPNVLTLHGWSELIFGSLTSSSFALLFDGFAFLLGLLFLAGFIFLSPRDRLILGVIILPAILVIGYLATRRPPSYYPIAKIALTFLPFVIGLIFVSMSRIAAGNDDPRKGVPGKLLCAIIVIAAAAGSIRYYSGVLRNEDLLTLFREPHFMAVCRGLEQMKNQRGLVFETNPLLAAWLCYHARHNEVYFDGRLISDSPVPPNLPFSKVPDLENIDQVATRRRLVDLKATGVFCLTSVDDLPGEVRIDGHARYRLGPPARLRFLASRAMSADLNLRLIPGPKAATSPVDFFLTDVQGHVFQDEVQGKNAEVLRMNLPRGLSYLELSVKAKEGDPNPGKSSPILAELDEIELSALDASPGS